MQINNKKDFTVLLINQIHQTVNHVTPVLLDKLSITTMTAEHVRMSKGTSTKATSIDVVRGEEYTTSIYMDIHYEMIIQEECKRYGMPMHQYTPIDMKKIAWMVSMRTVYDIAYELRGVAGYEDQQQYAKVAAQRFVASKYSEYSNNKQEERV